MNKILVFRTVVCLLFMCSLLACSDNEDDISLQSPPLENYESTGLPIVYIQTSSGLEVVSKDVYESAYIEIVYENGIKNVPRQEISIHGRGNSSWNTFFKKRSYTIKFEDKLSVLGMPKDKKWVLIANYRDKTLLRNSVAWWLSSRTGILKYTPRYRFVELVMNGVHRGTYQLVEQIKISKDRVNINEMSRSETQADKITGGYIIELDRGVNEDQWEWKMPNMCSNINKLSIKEPKKDKGNEAQFNYIYNYLINIDTMFGEGKIEEVMDRYIDMPSWAAQWLIYEISGTTEPNGPNSWYTYKDKGDEKWYCGPVWDFDYKSYIPSTSIKWINRDVIYMPMMLKYEPFRETLKNVWADIEPLLPELIDYIEEQNAYLEKSATLNWLLYDKCLIEDNRTENGDEFLPPVVAKDMMIGYLRTKWKFISDNIDNL